jgi:hypothetical protein
MIFRTRIPNCLMALTLVTLAAAPALAQGQGHLSSTLEAHGGLDAWQGQGTFTYTLDGFPLSPQVSQPNTATVDLHRRHHRIEGEGFTIGYDGVNAWSVPSPEAVGLPVRFFTLGSFYFIAMPHVFADPGVIVEAADDQTFRGENFETLRISYAESVGHTDEDDYILFIDPETRLLRLINHSVTEDPSIDRVTWVFDEWQEVSGLKMPSKMTFHGGWNPDDPGEGATFIIRDVDLRSDSPDAGLFVAPADAVLE